jgi:hypothetical protein
MSERRHDWREVRVHGAVPSEYRCRLCGAEWIANGVHREPRCLRVTATVRPDPIQQRNQNSTTHHEPEAD